MAKPSMKVQVDFELSDEEVKYIERYAMIYGNFLRDEPQKTWTESEKKKLIRYGIKLMVSLNMKSDNADST